MDEQIKDEEDSGDSRWFNPMLQPQDSMGDEQSAEVQPYSDDEDTDSTPATDEKNKKIRDAETTYKLLNKKEDRSMQDEAKFKSAIQILAKNK
jgi:hypothetical protein